MSVARVYAKALYLAASEQKATSQAAELDLLQKQLRQVSEVIQASRELQLALTTPLTTTKEKATVVREVAKKLGVSVLIGNFLVLLANKSRLAYLPKISEDFGSVRLLAEGGLPGVLVAAEEIEDQDVKNLAKAFSQKLGKRVDFQVSTDPSLLAGVKVTVNGVTYDGTLRSQLQRLRDRFMVAGAGENLT